MPELPEVETVRLQLNRALVGQRLVSLDLFQTGREQPPGRAFVKALLNRELLAIERRAKILIWKFSDDLTMLAHLKMTGRFIISDAKPVRSKHDRMLFNFETVNVTWSDVRKFGYVKLVDTKSLGRELSAYGPEPLGVDPLILADRLRAPKTRVLKAALLNQEVIAGIGNIYADEACYRAGLRPTRRLGSLSTEKRLVLAREIQNVLRESLALRGTSSNDYVDAEGERGDFVKMLRVYGRAGEACLICKNPIKKIVAVQRGTHYCPKCQV